MKKEPLVSILTPCFNGEKFVGRFLDSVKNQTYKNIELVFVDDGSTDRTKRIVMDFKEQVPGIPVKYLYQENQGQAAAINRGLKEISGKYLTWPDSDDILMAQNIEKKVEYLESHPNIKMVITDAEMVDEEDLEKVVGYLRRRPKVRDNLFRDIIRNKNVYFTTGSYMVDTNALFMVINDKSIEPSRAGQNWQLILPMAYNYRTGYIHESLYKYVVRKDSHSHSNKDYDTLISNTYRDEELLDRLIEDIVDYKEVNKFLDEAKFTFSMKRYQISTDYSKESESVYYKKEAKKIAGNKFKRKIEVLALENNFYKKMDAVIERIY